MSTHEQLQSENKTLHTDLQALTATISAQGARIAEQDKQLERAMVLMRAARYMLEESCMPDGSAPTAVYDGVECDSGCLIQEISDILGDET